MFLYGEIDVKFNEQIQNSVFSGERKSRGRLRPRFFKGDRETYFTASSDYNRKKLQQYLLSWVQF